jgi:hypothetical protein
MNNGKINQPNRKNNAPRIAPYNQTLKWKLIDSLALSLTTGSSDTNSMAMGKPTETIVVLKKIAP